MSLRAKLKRNFNIAYRPWKENIGYAANPSDGSTKAIIESMNALLVLYASYSELSDKLIKALSIEQTYYVTIVGRLITSALGAFVCWHILFSRKSENPSEFVYSKIPRLISGIVIWLVLASLVITFVNLIRVTPANLGLYESSYVVAPTSWNEQTNLPGTNDKTYTYRLNIPDQYKGKYKDIKVFVEPSSGFILEDVRPKPKDATVIRRTQEVLQVGTFEDVRSEWLFPEFDPAQEWTLSVKVGVRNQKVKFPDEPPVKATVYFYK